MNFPILFDGQGGGGWLEPRGFSFFPLIFHYSHWNCFSRSKYRFRNGHFPTIHVVMDGTIIIEYSLDYFIEMNLSIRPDLLRRDFSVGTCRVPARPWRVWTFHAVDIPASTWPPRRTLPLPASVRGTKIKIHLNKVEIKRRNFTWKRWQGAFFLVNAFLNEMVCKWALHLHEQ